MAAFTFQGMTVDGFASFGDEDATEYKLEQRLPVIRQARNLGIDVQVEGEVVHVRFFPAADLLLYALGDKHDEADLIRDLSEAVEWKQYA